MEQRLRTYLRENGGDKGYLLRWRVLSIDESTKRATKPTWRQAVSGLLGVLGFHGQNLEKSEKREFGEMPEKAEKAEKEEKTETAESPISGG